MVATPGRLLLGMLEPNTTVIGKEKVRAGALERGAAQMLEVCRVPR